MYIRGYVDDYPYRVAIHERIEWELECLNSNFSLHFSTSHLLLPTDEL